MLVLNQINLELNAVYGLAVPQRIVGFLESDVYEVFMEAARKG